MFARAVGCVLKVLLVVLLSLLLASPYSYKCCLECLEKNHFLFSWKNLFQYHDWSCWFCISSGCFTWSCGSVWPFPSCKLGQASSAGGEVLTEVLPPPASSLVPPAPVVPLGELYWYTYIDKGGYIALLQFWAWVVWVGWSRRSSVG